MSVAHYTCLFVDAAALLCRRGVPGRAALVLGPARCRHVLAGRPQQPGRGREQHCVHTVEFLCKSLRYCIDCFKSTIFCWLMG